MATPVPIRPLPRTSLHLEVAARVRDMIVEGQLVGGETIAERDLSTALGVSRTPLREALKVLASEGLVDLLPQRGARVRTLTAAAAREMLELIAVLEAHAALAACAASSAEIDAIVALHDRMRVRFERGERKEYFRLNQEIHNAIVATARNEALAEMHATLRNRLRRIRFLGHGNRDFWAAAMDEHETFIAALKARDGPRMALLMRTHLANAGPRAAAVLAGEDA